MPASTSHATAPSPTIIISSLSADFAFAHDHSTDHTMESSISVAVRVRPFNDKERPLLAPTADEDDPFLGDGGLSASTSTAAKHKRLRSIISILSDRVLVFDPPDRDSIKRLSKTNPGICQGTRPNKDARYAFDSVYGDKASQSDIYAGSMEPLLEGVMKGYNATVFAYGATGCGKTHTISGTPEDPGLIFMAMKDLFQRAQDQEEETQSVIRLSYLEIYNEQIRDLLSAEPTPPGQGLQLRDSVGGKQKISVVGLTEHTPHSPEEVLNMITEGNKRRTASPTEANAVSSRSHAVLQVNVMQRPKGTGLTEECTSASLNIIDLAGSERASATRNRGQRMMEGANINRSLLALANCINALCRPAAATGQIHIPYRDSKLTRLLKFSLGGNCRTVMIVCVSPSSTHFEETQKTLKYANSAKSIRTKVSQNLINVDRHVESYAKAILELQAQNQRLKKLIEEGKSAESDGDRRKKAEVAELIHRAKTSMQETANTYLAIVRDNAMCEARLDAARVQSASIRSRLSVVETERRRTPSTALDSEVSILQSALADHEAILNNKTIAGNVQALKSALTSLMSSFAVAMRNSRFDREARDVLQTWSAKLQSEGEAIRTKVQYDALLRLMSEQAAQSTDLLQRGILATAALQNAAHGVEQQAVATPSAALACIAGPLRTLAQENGEAFGALTSQTSVLSPVFPPSARPRVGMAIRTMEPTQSSSSSPVDTAPAKAPTPPRPRTARNSVSAKRLVSNTNRNPPPTTVRRVPSGPKMVLNKPSPRRASYAAPTTASRTRRIGTEDIPRRGSLHKAKQRLSKDPPQGKRVSTAQAAQRMPANLNRAPVQQEKRKVSLRWKDLAGQGELEERFSPAHALPESPEPPSTPELMEAPETEMQAEILGSKHTLDLSPTKSVAAKRLRPFPKPAVVAESTTSTHTKDAREDSSNDSGPPTTSLLSPDRSHGSATSAASSSPPPPVALSLDERPSLRTLSNTPPQPTASSLPSNPVPPADWENQPPPSTTPTGGASIFASIAKERDAAAPPKTTTFARVSPGHAAARASQRSTSHNLATRR